jgi:hypothetical protein
MIVSIKTEWTNENVNKVCEFLEAIGSWLDRKPPTEKEFQFIRGKSIPMLVNTLSLILRDESFGVSTLAPKLYSTVFDLVTKVPIFFVKK